MSSTKWWPAHTSTPIIFTSTKIAKSIFQKENPLLYYICVFGSATVETEYGNILLKKGESTLIAAQKKFVSFKTSEIKLLEVSL